MTHAVDWSGLLAHRAHRPYPLSDRPWIMTMSWHGLLFAHWRVDPAALRALVPDGLELDLFHSDAFVGVVPFRMTHVTGRGLPELPFVSSFAELNVRTYVVRDGKPGVYFFSLDAESALAVWGARTFFHLPYFTAEMACEKEPSGDALRYTSTRTDDRAPPGVFVGRYGPTSDVLAPAQPGSLEHFLTERYCLYAVNGAKVHRGEIHHEPWPLQRAFADIDVNTVAPAALGIHGAPPLLHFVRRLDVVGWALEEAGPG